MDAVGGGVDQHVARVARERQRRDRVALLDGLLRLRAHHWRAATAAAATAATTTTAAAAATATAAAATAAAAAGAAAVVVGGAAELADPNLPLGADGDDVRARVRDGEVVDARPVPALDRRGRVALLVPPGWSNAVKMATWAASGRKVTASRRYPRCWASPHVCRGQPQAFRCSLTSTWWPAMAPPRRHFDHAVPQVQELVDAGRDEVAAVGPAWSDAAKSASSAWLRIRVKPARGDLRCCAPPPECVERPQAFKCTLMSPWWPAVAPPSRPL